MKNLLNIITALVNRPVDTAGLTFILLLGVQLTHGSVGWAWVFAPFYVPVAWAFAAAFLHTLFVQPLPRKRSKPRKR